jgi:catechol 2,3-dioxygenase-like lactoylglutathione lyase family enzyme
MQFQNVTVWTDKLDEIGNWYARHLGLAPTQQTPHFVMLRGEGEAAIAFHHGQPLTDPSLIQFHFAVEDVDAVYSRLIAAGVEFAESPTDKPWGLRVASCKDPGGHGVEFVAPVRR